MVPSYLKRLNALPMFLTALALFLFSSAQKISAQPGPREVRTAQEGPTDPRELEVFLDGLVTAKMKELHCPGAVVALVQGGKILLTKGYGFSEVSKQIPVNPERTAFFLASVSKVFTATAVMQLHERGLIKVNEDVNHYLKRSRVESTGLPPVTVANLLTHTSGIEDLTFLMGGTPRRVFPPGTVISYSNHGINLAGELVEDVSGVPFADYVQENIFEPLEMTRSTFQPPGESAADVARGYVYRAGAYQPCPRPMASVAPSGSLVSTATDMAHFMIAHLQQGHYGDRRILDEKTAQLMHRQQAINHPKLPGMAFGFYEAFKNNLRALEHGGDLEGFQSELYLVPEKDLGLFIAINTSSRQLPLDVVNRFMDHYFPVLAVTTPTTPSGFDDRIERYEGSYRWTRCPRSTIGKVAASSFEVRVQAGADGTLTATYPFVFPWGTISYRQVEPLLFEPLPGASNAALLGFREGSQGEITYLFSGMLAFEKLPWYEASGFQAAASGFFVLTFLGSGLVWPLASAIRRLRRRPPPWTPPLARAAKRLVWVSGGLNLFFLVGLVGTFLIVGPYGLGSGVPRPIKWLLVIPLISTPLILGLLAFTIIVWTRACRSWPRCLLHSLYTLVSLAFIVYLNYWNLLGFRY